MKRPFILVADHISPDTIKALEQLLAMARRKKVIGIAFTAMYREREFIVNSAGEARRNPTWTRGMVAALDDELSDMVHKR